MNFKNISLTVAQAFNTCINILIPSLFPFFVLSDYIVMKLSVIKPPKIYKLLFRMPECTFGAYVSGLICGYPVGASSVYTLYENKYISKKDASDLICFSNNTGPLFIISAVGCGMFGDIKSGILLYTIHISLSIFTGIILSLGRKPVQNKIIKNTVEFNIARSIENNFMKCLKISGFIIFFSVVKEAVVEITNIFGENKIISSAIICLIEITEGISYACQNTKYTDAMCIAAFACGFSGLCIFLQTKLVTKGVIPLKKYFICKALNGFASAAICFISLFLFDSEHKVFIDFGALKPLFIAIFGLFTLIYIYSKQKNCNY